MQSDSPIPLKVLYLARWYPNRNDPMPGLFIQRHARSAAGFADVAVLYLQGDPAAIKKYEVVVSDENGVHTVRVYYKSPGKKSPLAPLLATLRFTRAYMKGMHELEKSWGKPDILHVNVLTRLGFFAWLRKKFHGTPYVITEHWSRYLPVTGTYSGFFRKVATRMIVKEASALSTVSANLAEAMRSHGLRNRNIMELPNVVDCRRFTPSIAAKKDDVVRMVHVSCFEDRSKNISGMLRVLAELAGKNNPFRCMMVGEGMDLEKMKDYAHSLGITDRHVTFTGLLEGEQLVESLKSGDFLLMFSHYENMPVVISEAFACGIPVVSSNVGGISEYVKEWNGLLVPPADEKALLAALEYMMDHYSEFDRQKIREFALMHFSEEAVAAKLKELYGFAKHPVS